MDQAARADTALYHVVDLSKPLESTVSVPGPGAPPPPIALRAAPNPGRGRTSLQLDLLRLGDVALEIFTADGRRIRSLHSGPRAAGRQWIEWDGRDGAGHEAPSGTYIARVVSGPFTSRAKFQHLR